MEHLITPYKGAMITPNQKAFNVKMSGLRVCVEHSFNIVVEYFAFIDFKIKFHIYRR